MSLINTPQTLDELVTEHIGQIDPSRTMDALVGEHAMGRRWFTFVGTSYLLPEDAEEQGIVRGVDGWSSWKRGRLGVPDYDCVQIESLRAWALPEYTATVVGDNRVMVRVRSRWDEVARMRFDRALRSLWKLRDEQREVPLPLTLQYFVGDYSRAALAALGVSIRS